MSIELWLVKQSFQCIYRHSKENLFLKKDENEIAKIGDDDDDLDIFSQGYFEGDIILNEPKFGSKSAVLESRTWPDATIPYIISDEYGTILYNFLMYCDVFLTQTYMIRRTPN